MKKIQFILIAILNLVSLCASANNIINPIKTTFVNVKTVVVKTNIKLKVDETYEIQRSFNNKNFKAVAIIFGTAETENLPAFKYIDKMEKSKSTVYYRVVKVDGTGKGVVVGTSKVTSK